MITEPTFNIIFILFNVIFFFINIFIYKKINNKNKNQKKIQEISFKINSIPEIKRCNSNNNLTETQKCVEYEKLHEIDFKLTTPPPVFKQNHNNNEKKDEQNLNILEQTSQFLISEVMDTQKMTEESLKKQKNIKMHINICAICDKDYHMNFKCNLIESLTPDVLLKILYEKNLCKICFRGGHLPNICPFFNALKCKICNKTHNTKLHLTTFNNYSKQNLINHAPIGQLKNDFFINSINKNNTLIENNENYSVIMPVIKNDSIEKEDVFSKTVQDGSIEKDDFSKTVQNSLIEKEDVFSKTIQDDLIENKINCKTSQNVITEDFFEYDSDESLESFEDELNLNYYHDDSTSSNELDIE